MNRMRFSDQRVTDMTLLFKLANKSRLTVTSPDGSLELSGPNATTNTNTKMMSDNQENPYPLASQQETGSEEPPRGH